MRSKRLVRADRLDANIFLVDLLITYSTVSLTVLRGQTIETQKPVTKALSGPSVLRVTDPYQRTHFFSLDLCKTWFVG